MLELLISLCVRAMLGAWEYSGAGVSPMFGDFEAQRHWLEITTNIDIGKQASKQAKTIILCFFLLTTTPILQAIGTATALETISSTGA